MNTKPYLILVYHLLFIATSMSLVFIIEGYGSEMFAGALYFNLLYLLIGGLINYLSYSIVQRIYFKKYIRLLGVHFLTCLLLMNIISLFLNSSWITWVLLKGIFIDRNDSFWVALIIHILMLFCYSSAFLMTKKSMQTASFPAMSPARDIA